MDNYEVEGLAKASFTNASTYPEDLIGKTVIVDPAAEYEFNDENALFGITSEQILTVVGDEEDYATGVRHITVENADGARATRKASDFLVKQASQPSKGAEAQVAASSKNLRTYRHAS